VDYLLGFLNLVIVVLTLFLIILILIQRGKGGGLAGAFGGMGGSSAFGARTGDVFTKVTVGVAFAWILLSMLMVVLTNRKPASDWRDSDSAVVASKDAGTSSGGSKSKSSGLTGKPTTPKLPGSTSTELLPSESKVLSELPDVLAPPVAPPKKN
jgi:preprotein translocase subunit SecG